MTKPHFLIIDDEDSVRETIRMFLNDGFDDIEIIEAGNGHDALKLYNEHSSHISVIICDYKMPKMDGFQFLLHLRAVDRETPFILVTGFQSALATSIALDDHTIVLSKPFHEQDLLELLKCILYKDEAMHSHGILLIDESKTFQFILRTHLKNHGGFNLITAESVSAGLRKFDKYQIDIVFTSLYFDDGKTGYDVANAIRAKNSDIPMVLLTSKIDDKKDKILEAGFTGWSTRNSDDAKKLIEFIHKRLSAIPQAS